MRQFFIFKTHIIMTTQELRVYRANLRTWYKRATAQEIASGKSWYSEAQAFAHELAQAHGVSSFVTAGVVSALSPNNKWERNKIDAEAVVVAALAGATPEQVKVCTYNKNKEKAFRILLGVEKITPNSPKTYAFAQNVGNLSADHITVDKWHLRACQTSSLSAKDCKTSVTTKQYKEIERETAKVAHEYGLKGYEFQAIVWVTIRNRWMNN